MRVFALGLFAFVLWFVPAAAQETLSKIEPVTIVTQSGPTTFDTEIADSDETRARGLMFRRKLAADRAMLFDFGQPRPVTMWMKNTYISLDMVFIRADGSVAGVSENTVPHSLDLIGVREPVLGVLEIAAGTARRLGLKPGDRVKHRIFGAVE